MAQVTFAEDFISQVTRPERLVVKEGFEVDLYEKKKLLETRQLHNHSESYAEDCADNWVQGVFNIEKEGSFYGYNERDDNYYPEIDD